MKNSARRELVEPCELCVSAVSKTFALVATRPLIDNWNRWNDWNRWNLL
jgi:hypothetical protein